MAFKVINDFISTSYQDLIHGALKDSRWMYYENMDYNDDEVIKDNAPTHFQFVNVPFSNGNIRDHELYYLLMPMIGEIVSKELPGYMMTRSRAILQVPTSHDIDMFVPHVDFEGTGMISAIYYVNDSDGDTVLFNESAYDVDMSDRADYDFTEVDRVSPEKGRLVIFPSGKYHCGSPPSKSNRMLINFNFERIPT